PHSPISASAERYADRSARHASVEQLSSRSSTVRGVSESRYGFREIIGFSSVRSSSPSNWRGWASPTLSAARSKGINESAYVEGVSIVEEHCYDRKDTSEKGRQKVFLQFA